MTTTAALTREEEQFTTIFCVIRIMFRFYIYLVTDCFYDKIIVGLLRTLQQLHTLTDAQMDVNSINVSSFPPNI